MNFSLSYLLDRVYREYVQLLTSGTQLLLLLLGARLNSYQGWLYSLAAITLVSVFAWLSVLYRLRALRDTPTSSIASAAQGYVELSGRGQPYSDTPMLSVLSRRPCLWCRYKIEQRNDNKWESIDSGETDDSFVLNDGSGECVINPEYAEIITRHYDRWQEGNYRYTEWKLLPQDEIYVIGQFFTHGGHTAEFDTRAELHALLSAWKKDMPALLRRFDLNQDGELDMPEWELATQVARREVEEMQRLALAQPEMHYMGKPADGKLFLISNLPQQKLSRRYLIWSWTHVLIFFGSLGGIGWVLQHGNP